MQTQNSKNQTPGGQYMQGDKGVQAEAKRAKSKKTQNSVYDESAIARAKKMRGMQ